MIKRIGIVKQTVLLAILSLSSMVLSAGESIRLMTEEFPPYQFYVGEGDNRVLTGISIEIVKALQHKIGNSDPIKLYPWSRGLKLLNTKKNRALFSTLRTPSREDKYKWVGPFTKFEMVFFQKAGSNFNIKSIDDIKKIGKVGVTKNNASHEVLLNMGFNNLDVLQSGADYKNLKRLLKGRVDFWPTAYFGGIYFAREEGVLDKIERVKDVTIMSGHIYMAFNKETDDQIINQWQSALDELKSEGVVDEIINRYDR